MTFIYALACPKTGAIRYIGKADRPKSRFKLHLSNARAGRINHVTAKWIRELLSEALEPELRVLFRVPPDVAWQDAEKTCIAMHISSGCDLTNSTAGGQGLKLLRQEDRDAVSAAMSAAWNRPGAREARIKRLREGNARPEAKANRVAAAMNPETRAKKAAACKAVLSTPEMKARMSEFQKVSRGSEKAKARQSEVAKLAWADPVKKAARVEALRAAAAALRADPERSAKKAAAVKAALASPEAKARLSAAMAGINSRPEVNAKRAATMKAAWSDPDARDKWVDSFNSVEAKAANSNSQKAAWAKRKAKESA